MLVFLSTTIKLSLPKNSLARLLEHDLARKFLLQQPIINIFNISNKLNMWLIEKYSRLTTGHLCFVKYIFLQFLTDSKEIQIYCRNFNLSFKVDVKTICIVLFLKRNGNIKSFLSCCSILLTQTICLL